METNEKLNRLFDIWERNKDLYPTGFIRDGIINEEIFVSHKKNGLAVLFIAKEANDQTNTKWDFRDFFKKELSHVFTYRLGEWAYGMTHNFPVYEEAVQKSQTGIQEIAFMNLKKTGGLGSADYITIDKHVTETKENLKTEIEIIDPDIIIGCGLYKQYWTALFGDINWVWSGFNIEIARVGSFRLMDYYHPSNRYPRAMNYALLEKVTTSKKFKDL